MRCTKAILLVLAAGVAAALTVTPPAVAKELDPEYVSFRLEQLSAQMRAELGAFQYLITPEQFDELLTMHHDYKRRLWIDDYWQLRDPVHTTPENELRNEHERRVAYAGTEFYIPEWPMWDQRGEVYIRYGKPGTRQTLAADVAAKGVIPPGELWYYAQHAMYVQFEDAFGSGKYTYYLTHVGVAGAMRMGKIGAPIDATTEFYVPKPEMATGAPVDQFEKMLNNFYAVREETPASYNYDLPPYQIEFYFDVDNFRGGEALNRVEVNMEFVADMVPVNPTHENNRYVASAIFWNSDREEVGRVHRSLDLPTCKGVDDSTCLTPMQLVFTLPPDFYHVAVTVEERMTGRVSSFRDEVACADFETRLALSNILFASKIAPSEEISMFNRGALEVVPHPVKRYQQFGRIPVYFEVYNLELGANGASMYNVEYRIISHTPRAVNLWNRIRGKKPMVDVASSFRASSDSEHDTVNISIGSKNLWPGEFALRVTITDENSNATVTREVVFDIEE